MVSDLANDNNGNTLFDGACAYTYDAWNHLIAAAHAYRDSGGTLHAGQAFAVTAYDGLGRRVSKAINGTGSWDGTLNYYLDGDSVIEEQNGSAMTLKQFIWGSQYIDDLVQVSLNSAPASQSTCDTPYWGLEDANWNVLGLVNSSGVLTERYEYSAYGQRQVFISAGTNDPACYSPTTASQRLVTSGSVTQFYGLSEVGFQGLMHDEETGNTYVRAREANPMLGRWMEEDPAGYVNGLSLYQEELSNPAKVRDPSGNQAEPWPLQPPGGTYPIFPQGFGGGPDPTPTVGPGGAIIIGGYVISTGIDIGSSIYYWWEMREIRKPLPPLKPKPNPRNKCDPKTNSCYCVCIPTDPKEAPTEVGYVGSFSDCKIACKAAASDPLSKPECWTSPWKKY